MFWVLVGLLSFLGWILFLVLSIINLIRKKQAKKQLIITGALFVIFITSVIASPDGTETGSGQESVAKSPAQTIAVVPPESTHSSPFPSSSPSSSQAPEASSTEQNNTEFESAADRSNSESIPTPSLPSPTSPSAQESQTSISSSANQRISAKVVRVIDGDTIEVDINGQMETVRLILVDTPETRDPNKPVEPFGPEATQFTKETLEGNEIELEKDVTERDRYGRLLMYVWIADKLFNEMLIEKGLARVAVYPPDVKYVDRFREVQKKAQQARVGIWSIKDYVTEDGFDESKAQHSSSPSTSPQENGSNKEVYYATCSAARTAGAAPLYKGDPGYRPELDRDGDGVACE